MKENIYVKTVYEANQYREPNISEYDSIGDAQSFINTCLRWGIGIVSCEITDNPADHSKG